MLKSSPKPGAYQIPNRPSSLGGGHAAGRKACRYLVAVMAVIIVFTQPSCLFKKQKAAAPEAPAAPIRIVLLPLNIPADNSDLRWMAMAAPVLMAKAIETSPDLEAVPLWQGIPVAVEALGGSRSLTEESGAYIASRLAARWTTVAEISTSKNGVSMRLDFIPTKANLVAYRYEKEARPDSLEPHFQEAINQFLRYLVLRPLTKQDDRSSGLVNLRELAEALDREYGWLVTAEPGKAGSVVANLMRSDARLARLLFNPSLYPSLGSPAAKPRPIELKPAPPASPEKTPPSPPSAQPRAEPPPPDAPLPDAGISTARPETTPAQTPIQPTEESAVVPPPKTFSQKLLDGVSDTPRSEQSLPPEAESAPALQPGIPEPQIHGDKAAMAQPGASPPAVRNKASPAASDQSFKIQVYSLRNKEEAEAKAASLTKEGAVVEIEGVEVEAKGILYRIRLTGYKSRKEALAAGEKLRIDGLIKEYWIVP